MKHNELPEDELLHHNEFLHRIGVFTNNKPNVFKQLVENISEVFWIRTDDEMLYINEAFEKVWGIPCNEIYKNPSVFIETIHPDDKKQVLSILNSDNFKETGIFDSDYRIIRPNNEIRWIHAKTFAVRDSKGQILRRIGIAQDITEQKISKQQNQLLAEMLDIAPGSITIHDETGKFLYANQKTLEIHGYSADEFMSLNLHELDVPETAKLIEKRIKAIKKNGYATFEVEHYKKNGSKIPLEIYTKLTDWKGTPALLSIATDISERKRMLEELSTSAEKYRLIVENLNDLIVKLDKDLNFLYVSPNYCKVFGVKEDEITGNTFFPLIHEEDRERVQESIALLFQGETTTYHQERAKTVQGWRWYGWSLKALKDENGGVLEIVAVGRDITEIKKSEEKFRSAFQYSVTGMALIDMNKKFLRVNRALCNNWGYTEKEILTKTILDVTYPEDRHIGMEDIKKAANGEIDFFNHEKRYVKKSGEIIYANISASIVRDQDKMPLFFIAQVEDITKQVQYQAELIKAKEEAEANEIKYKAAFYTSPDAVTINKLSGEYVEINEGFTRLTGFTEEDAIGKLSSEINIWSNPGDREKLITGLNKNGIVENLESLFRTKDGRLIPGLMSAKIIQLNNEPHILSVTREIAGRKKMEDDLKAAKEKAEEANRLKTEFLHNMSHEIRTPMNGIMGFSEMLDNPELSKEKRSYYAKIIQNSSRQLLKVIDDILEISTLETKQLKLNEELICLNDLLMELYAVFNLNSKERNIPVYLNKGLKDNQSYILTDKTKLNKILGNLLENALKFTSKGYIEIGYYLEAPDLVLYIKDTGIGISPDKKEKIFERFSQEDKEISSTHGGLGLGLSISKENAQLLGGDIFLESEKHKGSTFLVKIPYKPAHQKSRTISTISDEPSDINHSLTILLVEDEGVNSLYIEAIFAAETNRNYKIIHAKNGKEAIEICAGKKQIDLVLMDIKMPEMNGYEATEKIKALIPDLPVIAQTAYSSETDKEQALKHGCDGFISKPVNKDKLFKMINKHIKVK